MPPSIDEIPTAAQLQQRLDLLNGAITALGNDAPVTNLTVGIPANADPTMMVMPIRVDLEPPITDPTTITTLMDSLSVQAQAVEDQLTAMGYSPPVKSTADVVAEAQYNLSQGNKKWPYKPPEPEEPPP